MFISASTTISHSDGLSTITSISLGYIFVAGNTLLPNPTTITTLVTFINYTLFLLKFFKINLYKDNKYFFCIIINTNIKIRLKYIL